MSHTWPWCVGGGTHMDVACWWCHTHRCGVLVVSHTRTWCVHGVTHTDAACWWCHTHGCGMFTVSHYRTWHVGGVTHTDVTCWWCHTTGRGVLVCHTAGCDTSGCPPHLGVLAGADDVALAVHDAVHGDPGDDVGLDELQAVGELSRGSGELRLLLQGREIPLWGHPVSPPGPKSHSFPPPPQKKGPAPPHTQHSVRPMGGGGLERGRGRWGEWELGTGGWDMGIWGWDMRIWGYWDMGMGYGDMGMWGWDMGIWGCGDGIWGYGDGM